MLTASLEGKMGGKKRGNKRISPAFAHFSLLMNEIRSKMRIEEQIDFSKGLFKSLKGFLYKVNCFNSGKR